MFFKTKTLSQQLGVDTDADLVRQAKAGSTDALNALISRHSDLLQRKSSAFAAAAVPQAAVLGQAMKILNAVVHRYDPAQGVKFRTFLESNLRLTRFVNNYKNVARIPEHRALQITRFKNVKALLSTTKAQDPSEMEIAKALGWSLGDVRAMQTALSRRDLAASSMEFDQEGPMSGRFGETAEFLYYSLKPEEKTVYDLSLGAHGKKQVRSVDALARASGLSTDKIYRIKRDLAKALSSHR